MLEYMETLQNALGKGDSHAADFLLNYSYLKGDYKSIATDLCKLKALDTDLGA